MAGPDRRSAAATSTGDTAGDQSLDALVDLFPDATLIVDASGTIIGANVLARDLFGYEPGGLVGGSIENLVPERFRGGHEQLRSTYAKDPSSRPMGAGLDLTALRADGTEFPVDISLAPFTAQGYMCTIAVVRDISARLAWAQEQRELLDETQKHQRWLTAISEVHVAVLSRLDIPACLELITEKASLLAEAEGAWIIERVDGGPALTIGAAEGVLAHLLGTEIDGSASLVARVLDSGEILRTERFVHEFASLHTDGIGSPLGPALLLPLPSISGVRGILAVCRGDGASAFTDSECRMLESFATQAGIALQLADARADHEKLSLLSDRERIARDLHDHVIQRIFATGLALQSTARSITDPRVAEKVNGAIDELDATIRELRSTIFGLEFTPKARGADAGTRARLLSTIEQSSGSLGFQPTIRFRGPIDAGVPAPLVDDLVAVVREAVTNAARHAQATELEILVHAGDELVVSVADNGRGIGSPDRSSGMANMGTRASDNGGTFDVSNRDGGGTLVVWRVPL